MLEKKIKPSISLNRILKVTLITIRQNLTESFYLREHIHNHEQDVGGNIDGKGHFGEVSDINGKHGIEQWKKGDLC